MCKFPVIGNMGTKVKNYSLAIIFLLLNNGFTQDETCDILFIGSSYFNANNLPGIFSALSDSASKSYYIDRYIPSGLYLGDHAASSITETKINQRDWDYVVLQGVGSLMAYPDYYTHHPVYPALQTLKEKILANCPATKIIFCLPWAFEDGMTWLQGWTDTYADMQEKIYANTLTYANDLDLTIAPVGWAWYKVLEAKKYPLHYLHVSDWNHPSLRGSYLMACVIFSTIYQESTTTNLFWSTLDINEARSFQRTASSTVLDSLELWNITTSTIGDPPTGLPTGFDLYQNYPNPFNAVTTINYGISKQAKVKIAVNDLRGNTIKLLADATQSAGYKNITWNGTDNYGNPVASGMYFCTVQCNNKTQSVKMIYLK